MLVGRDISFTPVSVFHIAVNYEIVWKPKYWQAIESVENDEIIQSMLSEKKDFLCSMAGRISLLISQITSSTGIPPIITPGEFIIK